VRIVPEFKNGKLAALLSSEIKDVKVHYTTDGTEPTIQSPVYKVPVEINKTLLLKAAVEEHGRIMGVQAAKQNFVMHKAIGAKVMYANPVSPYYQAQGESTLVDGIRGNTGVNKYWHGFSAKDFIATVDLNKEIIVENISLGCLQKYNDWIFLPRNVKFEISKDNINFKEVASISNPIDINDAVKIYDFSVRLNPTTARYIRITGKNSLCPPGHNGAGKPGWIFVDEIVIQ
jgi:hexosaminidase